MVSPLVQAMTFQNSVNPAQTGIAPTDVVGAYKLASDVAEKNYQAQIAAQNAKFGGLAGLGGAGITAFGPSAAKSLFGQGASAGGGLSVSDGLGIGGSGASQAAMGGGAGGGIFGAGSGAAGIVGPTAGDSFAAPLASGASLWDSFPFASLGGSGALADAAAPAAGTIAADLGGTAAADAGVAAAGETALAGLPEWLMAILPFLA